MSRKSKREPIQTATEAIIQTTAKAEVEANQSLTETPQQLLNIEECARNTIIGYQPRWLPSLKAFANDHSRGDLHTETEWRILFSSWGASLK
jgi:hypothetical protein